MRNRGGDHEQCGSANLTTTTLETLAARSRTRFCTMLNSSILGQAPSLLPPALVEHDAAYKIKGGSDR